jgi:broad specificity phosphatase PhoE
VTHGRLVLLRHAETEWSAAGRHTGRTDVPLTAAGEEHARTAGERLAGHAFAEVRSSPLQRARRTAELAGFAPVVDDDLLEWDYGVYEGRTTHDIRADLDDPAWTVWSTTQGLGESVDDVGARARRAIDRVAPTLRDGGDVLLVAHAHLLRILTAVFLGLPPDRGRSFALGPGEIAVLGHEREEPVVTGWGL